MKGLNESLIKLYHLQSKIKKYYTRKVLDWDVNVPNVNIINMQEKTAVLGWNLEEHLL